MINKIVIGTANFSQIYGEKKIKINDKEFNKIKNIININNIQFFDTAQNYLNEKKLIGITNSESKIISKIPSFSLAKKNKKNFESQFEDHINKLNVRTLYGLLIHDMDDFRENSKFLIDFLKFQKKNATTIKIGFSVYKLEELDYIYKNFEFDILQFPMNLFDQRFLNSGWLDKVNKKLELHARSIFLQGILLQDVKSLNPYFNKWKSQFKMFDKFIKLNNSNKLEYLLKFVYNSPYVDKIILGINDSNNLIELVKLISTKSRINYNFNYNFNIDDLDLLLPYKWSLLKKSKFINIVNQEKNFIQ